MPAYLIATMKVHDPDTYREYTKRVAATVKNHGGKFLTRGDEVWTVEGDKFTERMVILEFPSKAVIEEWYKDPDYVEVMKYRHASSTARLLVQEGRADTENLDPRI